MDVLRIRHILCGKTLTRLGYGLRQVRVGELTSFSCPWHQRCGRSGG